MDSGIYDDPFAAGIPWYDANGQFLPDYSSGLDINYNLEAITVPVVPQVAELEHRLLSQQTLVQTFYEGPKKPKDKEGTINWVEKEPIQIPEAVQNRYNKAAIRIYKQKDHTAEKTFGGVTAMIVDSIQIQSPLIIDAIESILAEVGLRPADKSKVTIKRPFKELYFAYPSILDLAQRRDSHTDLGSHLRVLLNVTDELLSEMSQAIAALHAMKEISYEYLWTIFPKDIIVYSRVDGQDRLYQVVEINRHSGSIACQCVRFDGTVFGMARTHLYISHFTGARAIADLSVYPLGFHPDPNLEKRLAERGRQVLDFQDVCYREYLGIGKNYCDDDEDASETAKYHVTGRIIVDAFGFGRSNPDFEIIVTKINPEKSDESTARRSSEDSEKRRPSPEEQQSNKSEVQARRQLLLLMSPMLAGYSLTLKKWFWMSVDKILPLSWNEDAYDHLVLPVDHKRLLLSFVQSHGQSSKETDDVIAGKGQGLIVLLSGPPGTGKTLTAEAVADKSRRPLQYLHAEDLGTEVASTGKKLTELFDLALEWNSIVLLDEADVFLAKRSTRDKTENGIVSVVLHHLEYYRGIIFLTTNLLSDIDDAVLSRCHIHLPYPPLSIQSRSMLWKKFLSRLQTPPSRSLQHDQALSGQPSRSEVSPVTVNISADGLDLLAAWKLNGREIKNVVKTAHLWCCHSNSELTVANIEAAIGVTAPFAYKPGTEGDVSTSSKRQRLL